MQPAQAGTGDSGWSALELAKYGDRLMRAAFLLCRDEATAGDLVQETFCAALRGTAPFRGDSRPYTWLYAILYRLFLHNLRREKRRLGILKRMAGDAQTSRAYDESISHHHLLRVMDNLPRRQRDVVMMRFFEEMTLAEIAAVLHVPLGTVKSRLHHGISALRNLNPAPRTSGADVLSGDAP